MKMLTKGEVFGISDCSTKIVEVPEWGGSIGIKSMSGRERDEFEAEVSKQAKGDDKIDIRGLRALLIVLTAVNPDGTLMFERSDAETLNGKSALVINKLFETAQELNGLGDKAVKDLLGNSKSGLKDGSGSGSLAS